MARATAPCGCRAPGRREGRPSRREAQLCGKMTSSSRDTRALGGGGTPRAAPARAQPGQPRAPGKRRPGGLPAASERRDNEKSTPRSPRERGGCGCPRPRGPERANDVARCRGGEGARAGLPGDGAGQLIAIPPNTAGPGRARAHAIRRCSPPDRLRPPSTAHRASRPGDPRGPPASEGAGRGGGLCGKDGAAVSSRRGPPGARPGLGPECAPVRGPPARDPSQTRGRGGARRNATELRAKRAPARAPRPETVTSTGPGRIALGGVDRAHPSRRVLSRGTQRTRRAPRLHGWGPGRPPRTWSRPSPSPRCACRLPGSGTESTRRL